MSRAIFSLSAFLFHLLFILFPVYGSGERICIFANSDQKDKQTLEVLDLLQTDLKKYLAENSCDVRQIDSPDKFIKEKAEYRIDLRILKYKPPEEAPQNLKALGVGFPSLDIHYDLINPLGDKILSIDDGCNEYPEIRQGIQKMNRDLFMAITPLIEESIYGEKTMMTVSRTSKGNPNLAVIAGMSGDSLGAGGKPGSPAGASGNDLTEDMKAFQEILALENESRADAFKGAPPDKKGSRPLPDSGNHVPGTADLGGKGFQAFDKLRELEEQYEKGTVSKEEYEKKQNEILEKMEIPS